MNSKFSSNFGVYFAMSAVTPASDSFCDVILAELPYPFVRKRDVSGGPFSLVFLLFFVIDSGPFSLRNLTLILNKFHGGNPTNRVGNMRIQPVSIHQICEF